MLLIIVFSAFFYLLPLIVLADNPSQGPYTAPRCLAAGDFVPLECFEGSRKLEGAYRTDDLGPFMNKVFMGAISLGAILAVFRLAWAGFTYMASDLPGVKSSAKDIIGDTMLGLFLLLGIWVILYQINPDILKLKINITPTNSFITNQPSDI